MIWAGSNGLEMEEMYDGDLGWRIPCHGHFFLGWREGLKEASIRSVSGRPVFFTFS
jgi:hypothetical protein